MDNLYKGFSFFLSHGCHFEIDHDISTAHCRSSSGDLQCRFTESDYKSITTMVVQIVQLSKSTLSPNNEDLQCAVEMS